jgi:hypothetical protein
MAHYFIDLRDRSGRICDEEGYEFPSLEEALSEAKASARDLVKQYLDNATPLGETCVEVRDTKGRIVAVLTVAEVLDHPVHPAFKNDCADRPNQGTVSHSPSLKSSKKLLAVSTFGHSYVGTRETI